MQHPVTKRVYQRRGQEVKHTFEQQDGQGALQLPLFTRGVHDFIVGRAEHGNENVEQGNGEDEGQCHKNDDDVCLICRTVRQG